MSGIGKQQVLAELEPGWLAGLEGDDLQEGRRLLREVVEDWALEADPTPDPQAVLAIQRASFEQRGAGQDAAGRLRALRSQVAERSVDRLSSDTFHLGKSILDGRADDAEARTQGRAYLRRAEALAAELDALEVAADAPVRRELQDAMLDALYAVERQAMSIRLSREAPGAPSVS